MLEIVSDILKKKNLTQEEFAYRVFPAFLLDLMEKYLRIETFGEKNIPKKGPFIGIANHSGFMGFDALMLAHKIFKLRRINPKLIAHKIWFLHPTISVHAQKFGLTPATFENGLSILKDKQSLLLFPEGEEGNFKPTQKRYRLRRFRRGFLRLALATGAPICPAVVLGAEETHITLSQLRWAKEVIGIIVPIPLNIIPLPVKWQIHFLEPIQLKKDPSKLEDLHYLTATSREIRNHLQHVIHEKLKQRTSLFI